MPDATPVEAVLVRCYNPKCRAVLGTATAEDFKAGGVVVTQRTAFVCGKCGHPEFWRPGKKRLAEYKTRE